MATHYQTVLPDDIQTVQTTFRGFYEKPSPHGSRTMAAFHYPPEAMQQGAPYDLLRSLFRATGAEVGGVEHNKKDGSHRAIIAATPPVRRRIEEILAEGPNRRPSLNRPTHPTRSR